MSKVRILTEYFSFLKENKKWWAFPHSTDLGAVGCAFGVDAGECFGSIYLHSVLVPTETLRCR